MTQGSKYFPDSSNPHFLPSTSFLPACLAHCIWETFPAHLSWKLEEESLSQLYGAFGKREAGKSKSSYHTPLLQWETACQKSSQAPRTAGPKIMSNCQLTLAGNLTISALNENWNYPEINYKHSDYRKCYCLWVDYRLNKNLPFEGLASLWSFLPMKSRRAHKPVPGNPVLLSFCDRPRDCSWDSSPSQTQTMAYTCFNICFNIHINA